MSDMHHESEDLLDHEKFRKYQPLCAQANFLAIDRIDLPFGAKESCRSMSRPTVLHWSKLKRLVQTETNRTMLGWLSEAGVRVHVPGRARNADGLQQCTLGPETRRTDGAPVAGFSYTGATSRAGAERNRSLRQVRLSASGTRW